MKQPGLRKSSIVYGLAIGLTITLTACGGARISTEEKYLAPVSHSGGLAARDLTGKLRATPRATMGALEASD